MQLSEPIRESHTILVDDIWRAAYNKFQDPVALKRWADRAANDIVSSRAICQLTKTKLGGGVYGEASTRVEGLVTKSFKIGQDEADKEMKNATTLQNNMMGLTAKSSHVPMPIHYFQGNCESDTGVMEPIIAEEFVGPTTFSRFVQDASTMGADIMGVVRRLRSVMLTLRNAGLLSHSDTHSGNVIIDHNPDIKRFPYDTIMLLGAIPFVIDFGLASVSNNFDKLYAPVYNSPLLDDFLSIVFSAMSATIRGKFITGTHQQKARQLLTLLLIIDGSFSNLIISRSTLLSLAAIKELKKSTVNLEEKFVVSAKLYISILRQMFEEDVDTIFNCVLGALEEDASLGSNKNRALIAACAKSGALTRRMVDLANITLPNEQGGMLGARRSRAIHNVRQITLGEIDIRSEIKQAVIGVTIFDSTILDESVKILATKDPRIANDYFNRMKLLNNITAGMPNADVEIVSVPFPIIYYYRQRGVNYVVVEENIVRLERDISNDLLLLKLLCQLAHLLQFGMIRHGNLSEENIIVALPDKVRFPPCSMSSRLRGGWELFLDNFSAAEVHLMLSGEVARDPATLDLNNTVLDEFVAFARTRNGASQQVLNIIFDEEGASLTYQELIGRIERLILRLSEIIDY